MFGPIHPTQFDINFVIFGIPVRIHVSFWIVAAILGWMFSRTPQGVNMGMVVLTMLIVLLSILLHELGHAVTTRHFGWPSEIVLYFAGGFATTQRFSRGKNLIILFAGPLMNLLLAALAFAFYIIAILFLKQNPDLLDDKLIALILDGARITLVINLLWGIFNLLPVYPMDGGQITREVITKWFPRNGIKISLYISLALAILLCGYGLSTGSIFIAIFMIQFAMMNYQELQKYSTGPRNRF